VEQFLSGASDGKRCLYRSVIRYSHAAVHGQCLAEKTKTLSSSPVVASSIFHALTENASLIFNFSSKNVRTKCISCTTCRPISTVCSVAAEWRNKQNVGDRHIRVVVRVLGVIIFGGFYGWQNLVGIDATIAVIQMF